MSKASAVGQITVTSNGTTYNTLLQCNIGDIVQSFEGSVSSPTKVSPNYEASGATKPILMLLIFSAEKGNGNALSNIDSSKVSWIINQSVELKFNDSGISTNTWGGQSGHFQKTTYVVTGEGGVSIEVPALKVLKNLISINDGSSFTITASCTAPVTNSSVDLSDTYQVVITTATDATKKVSIAADDTHPFTIMEKGGTCRVVALIDGAETNDTSYKYVWKLFRNGTWEVKTCVSGKPNRLDINEADIDSFGIVKVEVTKNGTSYGTDIQTISDASDPYTIYPNPKEVTKTSEGVDTDSSPDDYSKGEPAAETFTVGDGRIIRYKPILKPESANKNKTQQYLMYIYDNSGNEIHTFSTPAKHFDVPSDMITPHAGCTYIIQTSD